MDRELLAFSAPRVRLAVILSLDFAWALTHLLPLFTSLFCRQSWAEC